MATDLRRLVESLVSFYDFAGKDVVDVGAGGGQLADYARAARRVTAVDRSAAALDALAARLVERGLAEKYELVRGDFLSVDRRGDVVLFEFCLHEMPDPVAALEHARALAADVVVYDHASDSAWEWYADEDRGVHAAWGVVERGVIRRERRVEAVQEFPDFAALESKLAAQGPESAKRIAVFRGRSNIAIPMPCRLVLV